MAQLPRERVLRARILRLGRRVLLAGFERGRGAELSQRPIHALASKLDVAVAVARAAAGRDLIQRDFFGGGGQHARLAGIETDDQSFTRQLAGNRVLGGLFLFLGGLVLAAGTDQRQRGDDPGEIASPRLRPGSVMARNDLRVSILRLRLHRALPSAESRKASPDAPGRRSAASIRKCRGRSLPRE